ncbi:MAG: BACON domain-containing protein [Muribaculaceae bacterium]|nr:BACON domain-containing protein [Muribaculaceae bacterium]
MKKIFKSFLIAAIALTITTSCDDNETTELMTPPAITIVSRSTNFPAAASTGSVKFTADGPVTVSTQNSWITATVEGDEIKIECTQNDELQGRTGVITAKTKAGSTDINIIQEGVYFQVPNVDKLDFECTASTYEIEVHSNALVEVVSDVDWISGECVDGILKINIDANPTFDVRTCDMTIKSGVTKTKIPVSQKGIYLEIFDLETWTCPDSRKTMTLTLPFDVPVSFSTDNPDWLVSSYNPATRVWKITAEANNTGHVRTSKFDYILGTKKGTVNVRQCDFNKDLASNDYGLFFTNDEGVRMYFQAALKKVGSNYRINITALNLNIPVSFDTNSHTFTLRGGQACGTMGADNIYTVFVYYDPVDRGNYFTWSNSWQMKGEPEFKLVNGKYRTIIPFKDPGNNPYTISYLELHSFSSTSLSGSTSRGTVVRLRDMTVERIHSGITSAEAGAQPVDIEALFDTCR